MLFFPVPDSGKGCQGRAADWYPARDVVRVRAARDFECPLTRLSVSARDDTTFDVSGCGKSDVYSCEDDAVSGCDLENASERESCSAAED
jgi:hypothetical protein